MNTEQIQEKINALEGDATLQNLIAQANARYILYNTAESADNFPNYTIKNENLDVLAFQYLSLGCRQIEQENFSKGIPPLEKGASILEYCHGSAEVQTKFGGYYALIASLSYYVCFQYSKAFILIGKREGDTIISKLVSCFLNRKYEELLDIVNELVISEKYTDEYLAENYSSKESSQRIYEITIAKSLHHFVRYFYSGDRELLVLARTMLINLKEIAEIKQEPDVWWVIRLLLLITKGFDKSTLWNALADYFDTSEGLPNKYIQSLLYRKAGGISELFISQRNSLPQVLNSDQGSIVSIPTSSGKTRIAEIAILKCLESNIENKVLFIAPFRSLAYEIENSLDETFFNMGVSVSHLYGGSLFSKLDEKLIDESQIIVATPEKAKAMLRANSEILKQIKLVVIDEGHLLGSNKRLTVNEVFYEELRHHVNKNGGKFLLLSAVLPNAEDLSLWLTDARSNVFKENWRPSDERLGVLEWNGRSVSLNWISNDSERNSFNPRFVISEKQPLKPHQRKIRWFPGNKNQAVAATAFKLRKFGPVLIFVGLKSSVFVLAREYFNCLEDQQDFQYKNVDDWKAFELACDENYGLNSNWLKYAKAGILCHNADLVSDVRLPLERLMYKEKPRVIIATSTLGQGVNLGVSTVIFSTLHQAGSLINSRDFWNIAGRAGRAFVDYEGKILVALETEDKDSDSIDWHRKRISGFFDKANIDNAQSGCLVLIMKLKALSDENGVSFETLLEIIANDSLSALNYGNEEVEQELDWIDDGLLALHENNSLDLDDFGWVDDYFRKSLAYIQAQHQEEITGGEVVSLLGARVKGIVKKVGSDREKWKSIINSGISLNSDLEIEEKLEEIILAINFYQITDCDIDDKIELLASIEDTVNEVPVLHNDFLEGNNLDKVRELWLKAATMSQISSLENANDIISKHYSFTLPWVLNGISKKLRLKGLIDEAKILEELSILVELGLPNLKSVKVYQAGIRSRSAAFEIGDLFDDELWDRSLKFYKEELITNIDFYKALVSDNSAEWLQLLSKFSKRETKLLKEIDDFTLYKEINEKTSRLIARKIDGRQFLISPDFSVMHDDSGGDIDFSPINNINGVFFDYYPEDEVWKMVNTNPHIKFW